MQDVNGINFIRTSSKIFGAPNNSKQVAFGTIHFGEISPATMQPKQKSENLDQTLTRMYKDGTLEKVLKETIPDENLRKRVLEMLNPENNNIEAFPDDNDPGTAQLDRESGRIIINTSNKTNINGLPRGTWASIPNSGKLKIIIHEAMHYAQETALNSQEEELLCESTAIRTAAALSKEDFQMYPPNYTLQTLAAMSDEELNNTLNETFIKGPYSNRRKFKNSGEVTISGSNNTVIEIPNCAEIRIGEREPYIIGETLIEGRGAYAGTVCNFCKIVNGKPYTIGTLVFDDIDPLPFETNTPQLQRYLNPGENDHYNNAVIIINGKEHNLKIFDFQPSD